MLELLFMIDKDGLLARVNDDFLDEDLDFVPPGPGLPERSPWLRKAMAIDFPASRGRDEREESRDGRGDSEGVSASGVSAVVVLERLDSSKLACSA